MHFGKNCLKNIPSSRSIYYDFDFTELFKAKFSQSVINKETNKMAGIKSFKSSFRLYLIVKISHHRKVIKILM